MSLSLPDGRLFAENCTREKLLYHVHMNYRTVGRSGLKVTPLGLGTDNFANPLTEPEAHAILDAAVAGGINLIDTSNSYSAGESERIIGRWLQQRRNRHAVVLATKVHYPVGPGPNDRGNSRRHILAACEDSLRRLQTDYIDLYQLHRPSPEIPVEETLYALDMLVRDRQGALHRRDDASGVAGDGSADGERAARLCTLHFGAAAL
jgi:aryl-alcohol dehydrogenase-like predicted oxidoreductase